MKYILLITLIIGVTGLHAQPRGLPAWFTHAFKQQRLDKKYELTSYLKPSFLEADFNGDGAKDIAALVTQKHTHKWGILLIEAGNHHFFVFGAGTKVGKKGLDESDNTMWDGWAIYNKPFAYLTKIRTRIPNKGISVWLTEDNEPVTGGIIYWDGKKYAWIYQGV